MTPEQKAAWAKLGYEGPRDFGRSGQRTRGSHATVWINGRSATYTPTGGAAGFVSTH